MFRSRGLLGCGQVECERSFGGHLGPLELIPDHKVTFIVKDKEVAERVKEDIEILKFVGPALVEVYELQRFRLFHILLKSDFKLQKK